MLIGLLNAYKKVSFGELLDSKGPIKCVSLNNQPCQTRPKLVDVNSRPRKKILSFTEMRVTKKIFTQAAAKFFY